MLKRNKEMKIELPRLKEKKCKNENTKVVIKRLVLVLVSILFVFTLYSLCTPSSENVLISGARKILASIGIYTEEVKSIEIKSDGYDRQEAGSWNIKKTVDWIGSNTAKITFDVDTIVESDSKNKDVIVLLDSSSGLNEEKSKILKKELEEMSETILLNPQNRIALISFNSDSKIQTYFTSNKDEFNEKIDNLQIEGGRNYTIGLRTVDSMLDDYTKEDDRELILLFITYGLSNKDTYGQLAEYNYLKAKYPYMNVNAIQYEMKSSVVSQLNEISDNQFVTTSKTLKSALYEAVLSPKKYETFEIVENIQNIYFDFKEEVDISIGNINVEGNKIIWNLGENFSSGNSATLSYTLTLKESYSNIEDFYPTNENINIRSNLIEHQEISGSSNKKTILKNYYTVTYDFNSPVGCKIDDMIEKKHFVYNTLNISEDLKENNKLVCNGYLFKGWEVTNDDVTQINSENFIMPTHDVTIRATWSKVMIAKSMDGDVHEKLTLYKVVKNEAESDSGLAKKYTGYGLDNFAYDTYYYRGAIKNNNVYFADLCWKMVRTTDTGGVKLIYNGKPSEGGTCDNIGIDSTIKWSSFNKDGSLANVGYMYNPDYPAKAKGLVLQTSFFSEATINENSEFYYSDSIVWNGGKYTLVNKDNSEVKKYLWSENHDKLGGYYRCNSGTETTCSNAYYIAASPLDKVYFISLLYGNKAESKITNLTISKNIIKNADGTYSLDKNEIINTQSTYWPLEYSKYTHYYMCPDLVSTDCDSALYLYSTTATGFLSENVAQNFKYANDVKYENGKYKLIDSDRSNVVQFWDFAPNYLKLNNNHYTCLSSDDECEEVYYIYYATAANIYYISLKEGKKVENALNEMIGYTDFSGSDENYDINKEDSIIKQTIDAWFRENLTNELDINKKDYSLYLENTIFCNDRSVSTLGGWNLNGGKVTEGLRFNKSGYGLVCPNNRDSFTVSDGSGIGNGKLKYPVGLLTKTEADYAHENVGDSDYYLNIKNNYWTGTPLNLPSYLTPYMWQIHGNGIVLYGGVTNSVGVRPVVSLRPGIEYIAGDGTVSNPFIIDTSK